MEKQAGLIFAIAIALIGAYCLAASYTAEEMVRLFGLFEMPKRLGYMLGGVGVLGSVVVLFEMVSAMREPGRGAEEARDPQ